MNKNMTQGCAKDESTQMTKQNQIRQGWHVHMRSSLIHLTFMASYGKDSQSNSNMCHTKLKELFKDWNLLLKIVTGNRVLLNKTYPTDIKPIVNLKNPTKPDLT